MSLSKWTQFSFFHYSPIRDPNFGTNNPLFSDPSLTALTAADRYIVFSIENCVIKVVDVEFNLVHQFIGFESGFTISFLRYSNVNNMRVLCAIGESSGSPTVLKLWNLDKLLASKNSKTGSQEAPADPVVDNSHHYITSVKIQNGNNQFPLTTVATSIDFSVSAFGFANGSTILVRGNLLGDKGSRQRIIYESKGEPITGVHLFANKSATDYYLYVLTTSKILLFETTGRNQNVPLNVLESDVGSNLFCNDIMKSNNSLVTSYANSESIDFYNYKFGKVNSIKVSKGLEQSRIFNMNDKYLLIVSSVSNGFSESLMLNGNDFKMTKIMVIDYDHNFIIFTLTIPNSISHIMNVGEDIYMLSSNGIFYCLHEKNIKEKIQILIQRELYPIAIQFIEEDTSEMVTKEDLFFIKKQYGDYLYDKGEYQEAISQYINSIDFENNAYNLDIILKFKDNDKILYLTEYLEHLCFTNKTMFKNQLVGQNEDYLTLLLCNYCKLKDKAKLDKFVNELELAKQKQENETDSYEHSSMDSPNLNFNIDLIIDLLLKINFNKITLKIAFIFKHYSMILDILINKFKTYNLCIVFLRFLKINDIFNVLLTNSTLSNYLKILLTHIPIATTKLLIDIFTGIYKPSIQENYIYQKFNTLEKEHEDLEHSLENLTMKETAHNNSVLQSYNAFTDYLSSAANNTLTLMNLTDTPSEQSEESPTYQPPKPRLVFMSFIDNPNEFVIFLEACLQSYDKFDQFNINIKDKKDLLITLFEMYLTLANKETQAKSLWESKAWKLYKEHQTHMDYNTVLLLCHLNNFSGEDLLLNFQADGSNADRNEPIADEHQPKEVQYERAKSRNENTLDDLFDIDDLLLDFDLKECTLPEDHPTLNISNKSVIIDRDSASAYNKIESLRTSLNLGNIVKSIEILNQFGSDIPELYSMTLFFVIKRNSEDFLINQFGLKNFLIILNKLLKSNVISIIDLINILSINDLIKFKFLKKFFVNYLEFKRAEIDKNQKLFDYYTQEIQSKKQEIDALLQNSESFSGGTSDVSSGSTAQDENFLVINNLKCDLCGLGLDFPIVHFMCLHSYHQRCLNDFEYDSYTQKPDNQSDTTGETNFKCPKCIGEMEAVGSLRAAQEEIGEKNSLFKIALEESEDKFKVITDFFGRGAMEHGRFVIDKEGLQ